MLTSKLTPNNSPWSTELLVLSAEARSELVERINAVQEVTQVRPGMSLANLARNFSAETYGNHRVAIVAKDIPDLLTKLQRVIECLKDPQKTRLQMRSEVYYAEVNLTGTVGKTAFLFPGYGSYYCGMLADLRLHFQKVREWTDRLDKKVEGVEDGMNGGAQAGFIASLALHELLRDLGVPCDVMVGHSNGENAALAASGMIRHEDREQLFEIMQWVTQHEHDAEAHTQSPYGTFLAVSGVDSDWLEALINETSKRLYLAIDNCPNQVVLFGSEPDIDVVSNQITPAGGICVRLPFDRAYHTPLYQEKANALRAIYNRLDMGEGHTCVYSCATTQPFPRQPAAIRALAAKQWSSPVKFRQTIENLYNEGVRTFVDVGPNHNLASFVDDILRGRDHLAIASNRKNQDELKQIQNFAAQLYVRGVPIRMEVFFRDRDLPEVDATIASLSRDNRRRAVGDSTSSNVAPTCATLNRGATTLTNHPEETLENPSGVDTFKSLANPRLAVLQSHYDLMQQFLASQARVMEALFGNPANDNPVEAHSERLGTVSASEKDEGAWPLLGEILEQNSTRLNARRHFNLKTDLFLHDHTFGRQTVPYQTELLPLPVVPFTISMEILAEAGSCLLGGKSVVGLSDVRSYRWLALDQGTLDVAVVAELQPERSEGLWTVQVQLFQLNATQSGERRLAFEGDVKLADRFPESPSPLPIQFNPSVPSEVSAADLYRDYTFHGPRFQGIRNLRKWDRQGIEVELRVTPLDDFFEGIPTPTFQIPAQLLDCAGQLAAYWLIIQGVRDFGGFPFYIKAFYQYGAPLSKGTPVVCRGRVQMSDRLTIEATFDFLDDAGSVIARLEGLQMRNYYHEYISRLFQPRTIDTYFSEAWMQEETGLMCRRIHSIQDFFEESEGIWKRVLAHLTLSEAERELWYNLPEKGSRRTNWLMGRVAAKDAVRQWAKETLNLELAPVDIEILATQLGEPFVNCPDLESEGPLPNLSISHSGDCAVAAVADTNTHLGIDIELATQMPHRLLEAAGYVAKLPEKTRNLFLEEVRRVVPDWFKAHENELRKALEGESTVAD